VNATYYFQYAPLSQADAVWAVRYVRSPYIALIRHVAVTLKLLPTYFIFGIFGTLAHNAMGHQSFLLGMYSRHGWWYYFPVAFALKTTLPFLLLSICSLAWATREALKKREKKFLILLAPVVLYVGMALSANLNLGVRHLLPIFPFLFILGGALLERVLRVGQGLRRRCSKVVVLLLVGAMAFEAFRVYPHYIPYMNQLTWGRPGWHYLSDSNVEWGDDAPELAEYLLARGEREVRAAFLGGESTLARYGVKYYNLFRPLGEELPETRYTAIGASLLNGSTVYAIGGKGGKDFFAAYREREPEAVFGGGSIYLYRERD
jgi:4-amino-4-deoxy-L-arabinose transferase-like glycosyltransferase